MKKEIKYFVLLALFFTISSCRAQMMQTIGDAHKLMDNKEQFIGKPLSYLLKEIKPEIKMVVMFEGNTYKASTFSFYFVTRKEYNQYKSQNKTPLTVLVYVKDVFKWDWSQRTDEEKENWVWTKEDEKRYGNLTVGYVKVYGFN